MGYDIYLVDESGTPLRYPAFYPELEALTQGAIYDVRWPGDVSPGQAWFKITYNYAPMIGDLIHAIEGARARATTTAILERIWSLKDDRSDNYWEATEGNARRALLGLLAMAIQLPDGIWKVSY